MKKEIKSGLVAVILVVLAMAGWVGFDYYREQKAIITEVDRKLSVEERQIYENRLAEADRRLGENPDKQTTHDLYMQKGFDLQGLGHLAESLIYFEMARDLIPTAANPYKAMYNAQLEMNNNRGALKSIQKAVELNPREADIWKKYILIKEERFGASTQELTSLFRQGLEETRSGMSYPDMVTAFAVFLEKIGDYAEAIKYWEIAIEVNPQGREVYQQEIDRIKTKL